MAISIKTLRGITRLTFDSVSGVMTTVERMHEVIARRPLPWSPPPDGPTRAHGLIARSVYSVMRGVTGVVQHGVDLSLGLVPDSATETPLSRGEVRWLAALNGVCGDHLEATSNPLAIPMVFTDSVRPAGTGRENLVAAFPGASPHLVVFVHGLCLSDFSWRRDGSAALGDRLAEELEATSVYLRYNTGRHISVNGRELAERLDDLVNAWPVAVESLALIGHSMGGLVIRSACHYAVEAGRPWLDRLTRIACLGTPHHGAALEKAGGLLDRSMRAIQYVEPLTIARRRSAGIRDLRHGNLLDEDWAHPDEMTSDDRRTAVPLLEDVEYYFVAASVGRDDLDPKGHMLGDFLVRTVSATGAHRDGLRQLPVSPENYRVFHEMNHFDLLSDTRVHSQVVDWFAP